MISPFKEKNYTITSPFGMRIDPLTGVKNAMHNGVDLVASSDSTSTVRLVATVQGTVTRVVSNLPDSWSGNVATDTSGNTVEIKTPEGFVVKYKHLAAGSIPFNVKVGAVVPVGYEIGTCGKTGKSTGVHLHYELNDSRGVAFDPVPFLGNDRPITWVDPYPILRRGDNREQVRTLQGLLNQVQDAGLVVDGSFGAATESAVMAFQKSVNVAVDGVCGVKTWEKLLESVESLNNKPYRLGDVNGDGKVTIDDALEIQKYLAKLPSVIDGNPQAFKSACVLGGEKPTIDDSMEILRYLAKLPSVLDSR
ncbi:MAG: peptidoglycan DD-metalloendopeptidase family protein [Oscillospiraceae bacterium]|nr:peptidoglycan DD-metalloendopeptidase family protein [Oscillospiraceae bacterium]